MSQPFAYEHQTARTASTATELTPSTAKTSDLGASPPRRE